MKKLIYSLILIGCGLPLSILSSCSDDLDIRNGIDDVPEGCLQINFAIAEPEIIKTRGENDIKSLTLYVFDADASKGTFYQKEEITTSVTDGTKVTIQLAGDAKNNDIILYAVANVPSEVNLPANPESIDDIKKIELTQTISENALVMNGESATVSVGASSASVTLSRVASKMTIQQTTVDGYRVEGFQLRNIASRGFVGATDDETSTYAFNKTGDKKTVLSNTTATAYFYASKGKKSDTETGAFLIISATKSSHTYYYCVDLQKTASYNSTELINLLANHLYDIEVTEIKGDGYASAEEAIRHYNDAKINYKIHDHAAAVLSMTTDGIRELGSKETITVSSDTYDFIVKCFTPNTGEYGLTDANFNIVRGSDWLQITNVVETDYTGVTTGDDETITDTSGSHNTSNPTDGKIYQVTIAKKAGVSIYSDKEAVIEVTWQGLKRRIQIFYDASFDLASITKVSLKMSGMDNSGTLKTHNITSYWEFLNLESKSLYGITKLVNGNIETCLADGKIRHEGFHLPMPYGYQAPDESWEYEYIIEFDENKLGYISSIDVEISGDKFLNTTNVSCKKESGQDSNKLTLKLISGKNDYTYEVGSITFTIHYLDSSKADTEITVDLYHTGFFHFEEGSTYFPNSSLGYYYYEVITAGNYHWLDRNVGAKSNNPYSNNGNSIDAGDSEAAGLYFKVGSKSSDTSNPTVVFDEKMCPPGYRIPTTTEWDNLRLSPSFITQDISDSQGTNMMSTFYNVGEAHGGKLYIQKARFNNTATGNYQTLANSGDDGAGYYWTRTQANGLEKDEIGKWLKALNLSGASNTYIQGDVDNHKMNVRCVANNNSATETRYSINFNVKGATHVYLYTVDKQGNKSGIFSFPGKAIGSAASVRGLQYDKSESNYDSSYLHFSYTSTVDKSKLRVFFAYMNELGKITIISRNGASNLASATGWPVEIGYNYFFDYNQNFAPLPNNNNLFPWPASGSSSDQNNYYFPAGSSVRVYWPQLIDGTDLYKIYIYDDSGNELTPGFPGSNHDYWIRQDGSKKDGIDSKAQFPYDSNSNVQQAYYKDFEIKYDCDIIYVLFSNKTDNNANTYVQTEGLEVSNNSSTLSKSITAGSEGKGFVIVMDPSKLHKR